MSVLGIFCFINLTQKSAKLLFDGSMYEFKLRIYRYGAINYWKKKNKFR